MNAGLPSSVSPDRLPPRDALTRDDARSRGLTRYWGSPCNHGHPGLRYVSSTTCCDCIHQSKIDRRQRDVGVVKAGPLKPSRPSETMMAAGYAEFEKASPDEPLYDVLLRAYTAMRAVTRKEASAKRRAKLQFQPINILYPARDYVARAIAKGSKSTTAEQMLPAHKRREAEVKAFRDRAVREAKAEA